MRCDEVTALLPGLVDGEVVGFEAERHIETCLRCQAELARYRRLLRTLSMLRTRYAEPTPGLLGETLAVITEAAEHGARRTLLSARRHCSAAPVPRPPQPMSPMRSWLLLPPACTLATALRPAASAPPVTAVVFRKSRRDVPLDMEESSR